MRPDGFDPRASFPSDPKVLGEEPDAVAEVLVDGGMAAAVEREVGPGAVREESIPEPREGAHLDHADTARRLKAIMVNRLAAL